MIRLIALLLLVCSSAFASDTVIYQPAYGKMYVRDASSNLNPAMVVYTTDGNGHVQPISSGSGGTVTANQGTGGASAWLITASSLPLPTGAATSANQSTANTTLAAISAQLPTALGAKTTANSLAVNIASDQTVAVSAASLPLPSGAATDASLSTANTNLTTINTTLSGTLSTAQVGRSYSGSITGTTSPTLNVDGMSSVYINLGGTWTGTYSFNGTIDGTNYFPLNCQNQVTLDGFATPSTSSNGEYLCFVPGIKTFKLDTGGASVTGTVVVQMGASDASGLVTGILSLPFVQQAGSWTVSVSDTGGNPCTSPGATLLSVTGATSGTAAIQIIALSGSTKVYICSMSILGVSGTTPTFSLVQGTGSNCGTSQTTLFQSFGTTAGQLYSFASPVAVGAAGNAVCYKDGGTTPVQNYQITYIQK